MFKSTPSGTDRCCVHVLPSHQGVAVPALDHGARTRRCQAGECACRQEWHVPTRQLWSLMMHWQRLKPSEQRG
jgi:hypothetical protein